MKSPGHSPGLFYALRKKWRTPLFVTGSTAPSPSAQLSLPQPFRNKSGSTADSGLNRNRCNRTVPCTGTAFHAGVNLNKHRPTVSQCKNTVRANLHTATAADTEGLIVFQRCHIFQIMKPIHRFVSPHLGHKSQPPKQDGTEQRNRHGRQSDAHFFTDTGQGGIRRGAGKVHGTICTDNGQRQD